MPLPVQQPIEPMLAKLATEIPEGDGWLFEPKWDGFRAIVFKDGADVYIQSRERKPLARYFPELAESLRAALPERCVVDGEIVIVGPHGLDFDALQLRLHPAKSRVDMLARTQPSAFVAFDLLALGDEDLREVSQQQRRARLEQVFAEIAPPIHLTPATRDRDLAQTWFAQFEGAGLDGVMAKPQAGTYRPNERAMLKIKHARTADCVVAGFRWHKNGEGTHVGSLLLGLFDAANVLHHVGIASSFTMARRKELVIELAALREHATDQHPWREWATFTGDMQRKPGAESRWSRGKDLSWEPLRVERVCEVKYDHLQGTRFRHATHFVRWRPERTPQSCRYDQLEVAVPYELSRIFGLSPSGTGRP